MLSDPQTIASVAYAKTRVADGVSEFTDPTGNLKFIVKQNTTKARFRREIRISVNKVAADPISAINAEKGASIYLVIDEPRSGFSDTELKDQVAGLAGWLVASSYANVLKVLGGEY